MLNVFISYARKDGVELAQRLQADLSAAGFEAWLVVSASKDTTLKVWDLESGGRLPHSRAMELGKPG